MAFPDWVGELDERGHFKYEDLRVHRQSSGKYLVEGKVGGRFVRTSFGSPEAAIKRIYELAGMKVPMDDYYYLTRQRRSAASRRPARRGGAGYCRICRGPHVRKHGRP